MSEKQSWLLRFRKSPAHTQANIVCTAIIALATVVYTCVAGFQLGVMRGTLSEMKRSGEQSTNQMWAAIDNVNWLARSADWSQKVAQQQASATVAEMQKQTIAQQSAAIASQNSVKATRDAMYAEQRPWVGIEQVSPASLPPNILSSKSPSTTVIIVAHNTGRTPAIRWRMECCEAVDQDGFDPIPPDYDTLHKDVGRGFTPQLRESIRSHPERAERLRETWRENQASAHAYIARRDQETIIPNGYHTLDITTTRPNDHRRHFQIGKLVHFDTIDPAQEHVTNFCLWQLGNSPIMVCTFGQDMK
jgi:hypothetical protein